MRVFSPFFLLMMTAILASVPRSAASQSDAAFRRLDGSAVTSAQIDAEVERRMTEANVPGLALALIQDGRVVYRKAYGLRNVGRKRPLETDTVMYAASLTKLAFAYMVMQLVEEGKLQLDQPLSTYLKKPLPDYPKYADLAGDSRWKALTPRMLLDHTPGFPNFRFINPNGKLDFKFAPGTRYAYSGEGINLMQFVMEEGLGLDVGKEMQRRVFDRFGMKRTSMTWREDFAPNVADGYDIAGAVEAHHQRGSVRAAGSMDTTITDYARFLAGFLNKEGLSARGYTEMLRPQIAIASAHQFPTLEALTDPANRAIGLSAGLGPVLFQSRYGTVFFKGGHDDWTANMVVGVESQKSGIVLLSNSVRAEIIYPALIDSIFGKTPFPWTWEYNPTKEPPPAAPSVPPKP